MRKEKEGKSRNGTERCAVFPNLTLSSSKIVVIEIVVVSKEKTINVRIVVFVKLIVAF